MTQLVRWIALQSDMAGVEAVLEEMRSIGVLPDTNTYTAAMKACGKVLTTACIGNLPL